MRFYIGAYTSKGAAGIYQCEFDPAAGVLGKPSLAVETRDPSFLAMHPNGKFLYAVNETDDGQLSAFVIDRDKGRLQLLNQQATRGAAPCHVSIDPAGRTAMVANYGSGNIAAFTIDATGRLSEVSYFDQHHGHGPNPKRQEGPHAHCIVPDRAGRFAFSCDLGLDQVLVYEIVSAGQLQLHSPPYASTPPGAGPRHIKFHPTLPFAYVVTEMGNTICVYRYDAIAGTLTPTQVISTLTDGFKGETHAAEIQFSGDSRFLYVSNRGDDSIVVFAIDAQNGQLRHLSRHSCGGKNPRHFALDPSRQFLLTANQDSGNVALFKLDNLTGALSEPLGEIKIPAPVCVLFHS
jgi:6-phosphogluconolactonase